MGCNQFGRLHKLRLHGPQLLLKRGVRSAATIDCFFQEEGMANLRSELEIRSALYRARFAFYEWQIWRARVWLLSHSTAAG